MDTLGLDRFGGYGSPYPLLKETLKPCADALYAIARGRD